MDTVKLLIDGEEEVEIERKPLMVCLPREGMEIAVAESEGYVLIGPEETVALSNRLPQEEWDQIRQHEGYLGLWATMFDAPPPVVLSKASLAYKHVNGLILMTIEATANKKPMHWKLPESYLHPVQCAKLMTFYSHITGRKL